MDEKFTSNIIKTAVIVVLIELVFIFSVAAANTSKTTRLQNETLQSSDVLKKHIHRNARNHMYIIMEKQEIIENTENSNDEKQDIVVEEETIFPEVSNEQNESEYPYANQVWIFLKDQGYSDYVCAGIIGNMMVECGGNTLALQPTIQRDNKYYGICQWSNKYFPEVYGLYLEEQCIFLISNLAATFNTYGYLYKSKFSYERFISLTNEKEVALAFAKCYERCGKGSYNRRKKCASIALNYFKNNK